jgi:predicted transcriptional regulator of viral defense system
MSQAMKRGISRYMLYALRDTGVVEQVSRGVYRLTELPRLSNPNLVTVALRYPGAVIYLVSALAFNNLTTQIPHRVFVAVSRNSRPPSPEYPPLSVHRFSEPAFSSGIEEHTIDGVPVNIYSPEKTLADCFKFRNTIGMDVVLEALKLSAARAQTKWFLGSDAITHSYTISSITPAWMSNMKNF